ncbi:MAG: hypothetical protein NTU53_00520 [Planctomycetota bacterium]|nr:hypothetical protein [Planctomycetota bacterium]
MDGMEPYGGDDAGKWDDLSMKKWNFFYRPGESRIGLPQKEMIQDNETLLFHLQYEISSSRRHLTDKTAAIKKRLILEAAGSAVALIAALVAWAPLAMVPIIFIGVRAAAFALAKAKLEKAMQKNIADLTEAAQKLHAENEALNGEIRELVSQIPTPPSPEEVQAWFDREIQTMEQKLLSDVVAADIDEHNIGDYIRHEKVANSKVRGLLVDGWGLLQPAFVSDSGGDQRATGKRKVIELLDENIMTFRQGTGGNVLFRVWYLQYIFLLDKQLVVCGFYYDFIRQKTYGQVSESFSYQHVTNYSLREGDLEKPEKLRLPPGLQAMFQKPANEFRLVVASGAQFKCVLVDDSVIDGMNAILKQKSEQVQADAGKVAMEQLVQAERDKLLKDGFEPEIPPEVDSEMAKEMRKDLLNAEAGRRAQERFKESQRQRQVTGVEKIQEIRQQESIQKAQTVRREVGRRIQEVTGVGTKV